jgi:hypothetical protein
MALNYYGRTQELTTASFSVQAVDLRTGKSAAAPVAGSVKFTPLNREENFKSSLNAAVGGMGAQIKSYWKKKVLAAAKAG